MLISFGRKFNKQYQKADLRIKTAFDVLDNHPLIGNYLGKRSINITGDWRAVYSEVIDEEGERIINFHLLGIHSQLYK